MQSINCLQHSDIDKCSPASITFAQTSQIHLGSVAQTERK